MTERSTHNTQVDDLKLFKRLEPATRDALRPIATVYHLQPGEMLYHQGDMAYCFYVVRSGGIRLVEHTDDGKDVNIKVYGPQDAFGMLAISGPFAHDSSAVAVSPTELVSLRGDDTRRVMLDHPELALLIIDSLTAHVQHAHSRIRSLAVEKTQRRLARSLLHFYEKFGHRSHDGLHHIDVGLSQQDIAEFTGTTQETVNRLLRTWEKQQIIRRSRLQIVILNLELLQELAADPKQVDMAYMVS